ncbi:hypothetical protein ANN_15333, partial [Periplaneta americana]
TKERHTITVDIRFFRGADYDSDHYLIIGELRGRLSATRRVEQQVNIKKFNIPKLKNEETKQHLLLLLFSQLSADKSEPHKIWCVLEDIPSETTCGYDLWKYVLESGTILSSKSNSSLQKPANVRFHRYRNLKLIRLVDISMKETVSCIQIQGELGHFFNVNQGLKTRRRLAPLLFNLVLEHAIRKAQIDTHNTLEYKSTQAVGYSDDINIMGRAQRPVIKY